MIGVGAVAASSRATATDTSRSTSDSGASSAGAQRGEQLGGRFLLATLDLGDVAQAHPRLGRDLAQGQALLEATLTKDVAQQPAEQRHLGPPRSSVWSCERSKGDCGGNATREGVVPPEESHTGPTAPLDTPGPGSGAGRRSAPSSAPSRPPGPASPTKTVPTGLPSCESGPATPVVARAYVAPVATRQPGGHRAGALRRHHAVLLDELVRDPQQRLLELGRVGDEPADVAGRGARHRR